MTVLLCSSIFVCLPTVPKCLFVDIIYYNYRYGIIGDAVHIAGSLESSSYSRRIQCSEKSARLLRKQAPEIQLTKRGKIGVKGRGDMVTYWVGKDASKEATTTAITGAKDGKPQVDFWTEPEELRA